MSKQTRPDRLERAFEGVSAAWLRWYDAAGNWLLTDTEQAQQQLEQVQTQLLQAAQNLLATGMTLEQVTQMLNLSATQVETLRSSQERDYLLLAEYVTLSATANTQALIDNV